MESITLPVAPLTALLWEEEQRLRSALITMMETHRDESEELWAGGGGGGGGSLSMLDPFLFLKVSLQ